MHPAIRLKIIARLMFSLGLSVWTAALAKATHHEPELFRTAMRIQPTEAQLDSMPELPSAWRLPPRVAANVRGALAAQGFSSSIIEDLAGGMHLDPTTGEGIIRPASALLEKFQPSERERWSELLALHPANVTYRWPLSVFNGVLERLAARPHMVDAVEQMRRWGERKDDRVILRDVFLLNEVLATPALRRGFLQEALGARTLFVKLEQDPDTETTALEDAAYWQVHGRYQAIQPFLNAIRAVKDHDRIDVAHILPRLARSLIYTYPPDFAAAADPAVENAIMATQFVGETRDARGALARGFGDWLARECVVVTDGSRQYGDIVVYEDPSRSPWPFAMIYLADGVVFGRRPSLFGPWELLDQGDPARINPRLSGGAVVRYRRKTAVARPKEAGFDVAALSPAMREQLELRPLAEGPWGRLWCYDVALAPPGDLLEAMPDRVSPPSWTFRGLTSAGVIERLERELPGDGVGRRLRELFLTAEASPPGMFTVRPPLDLVLDTPRPVRAWLYPNLVYGVPGDDYLVRSVVQTARPIEEWFDSASLPGRAREVVLSLVHPRGRGYAISDYGALFQSFPDRRERLSVVRTVLRTSALIVLLERPLVEQVPEIVRYWELDGQKGTRQLLESFSDAQDMRFLDIIHLIPPMPREYMNLYLMRDGNNPTPSCYWTAFNFAADIPDSKFLVVPYGSGDEARVVADELRKNYLPVENMGQLGDVIVYRRKADPVSGVIHACTYVAADIVYTRNGHGIASPWCLARLSDVDAIYLDEPVERVVFRRTGREARSGAR